MSTADQQHEKRKREMLVRRVSQSRRECVGFHVVDRHEWKPSLDRQVTRVLETFVQAEKKPRSGSDGDGGQVGRRQAAFLERLVDGFGDVLRVEFPRDRRIDAAHASVEFGLGVKGFGEDFAVCVDDRDASVVAGRLDA